MSTSSSQSAVRTGAQIIWEALVREGVDTVFGYPGGAVLPIYDALHRDAEIQLPWSRSIRGDSRQRRWRG